MNIVLPVRPEGSFMSLPTRFAVFTICSNDCLPAARTLLGSLHILHPEADLFLCLVDERLDVPDLYDSTWTLVEAACLPIQDFMSFAFGYDIMEMNIAVKPFMFQHLLDGLGYQVALYFDQAVEVFQRLDSVLGPLGAGASLVLTPHLCQLEDEPNDLTMIRSGAYNLGFLGVSRCAESRKVLAWWARRLRYECFSVLEEGNFVDQNFLDLVPEFAPQAHMSHDTSLNVTYWNLDQRRLEGPEGGWRVDGRPLTFFRYSGFDPRQPDKLLKYARRYDGAMTEPLLRITADYAAHLQANTGPELADWSYAYGRFASGTKIHPFVRNMFRQWHMSWGDDPFQTYEAFLYQRFPWASTRSPGHIVSNFMKYLYDRFPWLHGRLNLADPQHVRELVEWYWVHAEREFGLDPAMIHPEMWRRPLVRELEGRPIGWSKPDGAGRDVTVIGYLRAASGVGEVGRQTLRTLWAGGVAAEGYDVDLNVATARDDQSCSHLLVGNCTAPVQIFNINADQLPLVIQHLGPHLRSDSIRINIPFWELSRFPDAWLPGLSTMDEIWAPSHFIVQALEKKLGKKVVHMPVAIELKPPPPAPRAKFNLPEDRFLFFFAFDFFSFIARKNPHAVIAAFRKAFPKRGQAGLVLKCINGTVVPHKLAAFRALLAHDPDIFLIEETLSRTEMLALIASSDAVVSLHRSEGLGLLIGEAMLLGKPVIATDYSASQDLLSADTGYPVNCTLVPVRKGEYPFAKGQFWAEPDVSHAARLMRDLCHDPSRATPLVCRAREQMEARFSYKNVGRLQADRLRELSAVPSMRHAS